MEKSTKTEIIIISDSEDDGVQDDQKIQYVDTSLPIGPNCVCGLTLKQALIKTRLQLAKLKDRRTSSPN